MFFKLFVCFLVLNVFIVSAMEFVGIPNSRFIYSFLHFGLLISNTLYKFKIKRRYYHIITITSSLFFIGTIYIYISVMNHDLISGLAGFKTFFIVVLYILYFYKMDWVTFFKEKNEKFINNILLLVALFSIIEYNLRFFNTVAYDYLLQFISYSNVGGLNYLKHGGGWGIQPLGIFFDMHTHTSIFIISVLLSYIEKIEFCFFCRF